MNNYIKADIGRILRKGSFLGAAAAFWGLFLLQVFVYFNPSFTAEMYVAKNTAFTGFFPLVVGLFVFMCIYADDFKCKSMQIAIGYGTPRRKIIIAKLIESMLLLIVITFITGFLVLGTPLILGLTPTQQQLSYLALTVVADMLRAIGYIALSTIPVFFTQNAVNGIIVYVLLSSKTVYIILTMIWGQELFVNLAGDLTQYLYTTQLYDACTLFSQAGQLDFAWMIAPVLYVFIPTIIAIIGFNKKELEF